MPPQDRKPLHFVSSSLKDLRALPEDVKDVFGAALLDWYPTPSTESIPRERDPLARVYHGR